MKDICEATQLSGEEKLEVSQKSSLTRPKNALGFRISSKVEVNQDN